MERIYSHENGYIVVREHEDGDFTTYLFDRDVKEVLDERGNGVGSTYKSLESALRYAARKAGASNPQPWEATRLEERFGLTYLGSTEQGGAGGVMRYDAHRDEVGLWHLTVSVHPCYEYAGENLGTKEVTEYRSEDEAWEAYDAVRLRDTGAYGASKTLERTVLTEDKRWPIREYTVASEHYSGWAHHHNRNWMAEREA